MKNLLLASTVLAMTAGVAAADVTLSGSGRFGLVYNNNVGVGESKTTLNTRLRFNFDASVTVDSGATFGGRIRMQSTQGSTGATLSAADLYVKYNGLKLEVGNVNTAYDSAALMYDSELDFIGDSAGDPLGTYDSFSSGPYSAADVNREGIAVFYNVGALNAAISYVTHDQTASGLDNELGISGDYTFGAFQVSAAYAQNGSGIKDNNVSYVGVAYKFSDVGTVGLQYFDDGDITAAFGGDNGTHVTLYGNYKFGAITARAYVADTSISGAKTAFGIGADYDLGGATLSGGYHTGYSSSSDFFALGVKFSF